MAKFIIFLLLFAVNVKNSIGYNMNPYIAKDLDSAYKWAQAEIKHQKQNPPECYTYGEGTVSQWTECSEVISFSIDTKYLTEDERFGLCFKMKRLHRGEYLSLSLESKIYGRGFFGPTSCEYGRFYEIHHYILID